ELLLPVERREVRVALRRVGPAGERRLVEAARREALRARGAGREDVGLSRERTGEGQGRLEAVVAACFVAAVVARSAARARCGAVLVAADGARTSPADVRRERAGADRAVARLGRGGHGASSSMWRDSHQLG